MIQNNNIGRYISRLNTIIVTEITLGHEYRWQATTICKQWSLFYIVKSEGISTYLQQSFNSLVSW